MTEREYYVKVIKSLEKSGEWKEAFLTLVEHYLDCQNIHKAVEDLVIDEIGYDRYIELVDMTVKQEFEQVAERWEKDNPKFAKEILKLMNSDKN